MNLKIISGTFFGQRPPKTPAPRINRLTPASHATQQVIMFVVIYRVQVLTFRYLEYCEKFDEDKIRPSSINLFKNKKVFSVVVHENIDELHLERASFSQQMRRAQAKTNLAQDLRLVSTMMQYDFRRRLVEAPTCE
jgi:hypothetical protein